VFVWFCGFRSNMSGIKAEALANWASSRGAGCLRFDYSGHGLSGGEFERGTIGQWLDQADALCAKTIGDGPCVFVGSSMGGWIALLLALRWERQSVPASYPKGIALIAPAWNMTQLFWERASGEARAALQRDGAYMRPSAYGDGPYAITKALLDEGENHLLEAPIGIGCPVRIFHGCDDPDIPWRRSLDLMEGLSGGDVRLTLIKDGDHRLSRPQDLALLFGALEEFLP
jgi:alpha-beta hydrolase superfamily lysophospholipase